MTNAEVRGAPRRSSKLIILKQGCKSRVGILEFCKVDIHLSLGCEIMGLCAFLNPQSATAATSPGTINQPFYLYAILIERVKDITYLHFQYQLPVFLE